MAFEIMSITKDHILIEIVKDNPLLASVVDRFGISFSNWTLSIEQACEIEKVDVSLLIEMLKAFSENNYFPAEGLSQLPIELLIEYLIKTHIYYINSRLPHIEQFIDLLIAQYGNLDLQLYLLKDYFREYKRDMLEHIRSEERTLFPYILKLIRISELENKTSSQIFNLLEKNAITQFINEHHHVEDELAEMRRRLNNYSEANNHKVQTAALFFELRMFELDLFTHSKVEDEILIPRAKEIESRLKAELLSKAKLN
jgi:regulator of cell morphogenesis and NO signaling